MQADDDPDDDEDTSEPGTVLGAPHKIAQILKAIKKHAGSVELLNIIRGKLYALIGQEDPRATKVAQDSYFAEDKITRKC